MKEADLNIAVKLGDECLIKNPFKDMRTKIVCVWPDETWCNIDKIEEYTYMSDDYKEEQVDASWSDDQICEFIEAL